MFSNTPNGPDAKNIGTPMDQSADYKPSPDACDPGPDILIDPAAADLIFQSLSVKVVDLRYTTNLGGMAVLACRQGSVLPEPGLLLGIATSPAPIPVADPWGERHLAYSDSFTGFLRVTETHGRVVFAHPISDRSFLDGIMTGLGLSPTLPASLTEESRLVPLQNEWPLTTGFRLIEA